MIPDPDSAYQLFGRRLLAGCNSTQRTNDFSWIAAFRANAKQQFKEIVILSERFLRSEPIWVGRAEQSRVWPASLSVAF
jgi:hypothetical protein